MDNQTNTIAGWALAAAITALGLTIASGMVFSAHAPETPGYPIEGAAEGGEESGAAAVPIATLLASADVAKGGATFAGKCGTCHTVTQGGANGVGPNLYASVGKAHGHVAGFAYSDALKGVPGNWDFEALNAWLLSPRKYAPGTKMTFAGLSDPQDRANVIAYLNSQGSNLPLPAAPAPDAPAADAAEANAAAGVATSELSNQATPAPGAPSQDPQADVQAAEKGPLPKSGH